MKKIVNFIKGYKIVSVIILCLIILGGYFGYQAISGGGDETVRYTVATVEKDILIVSVSGSGQVTVLDQVDIKPEVS
ncbi:hypothetical protein KKG58_02495, partial [Patescibacteria group bacterium]|nr:hypothetical protein [Patescibacteria group bacterium]